MRTKKRVFRSFGYLECDAFAEYLKEMAASGWHFSFPELLHLLWSENFTSFSGRTSDKRTDSGCGRTTEIERIKKGVDYGKRAVSDTDRADVLYFDRVIRRMLWSGHYGKGAKKFPAEE